MLSGFGTVILDEIHAVADSKRGTYLMSAGERLALFSGEFQRIVLSATLRPISLIADFVGGRHNSTLLFVNSRRMAEKLSRYIRETETGNRVYAHHGSLSKEFRKEVEMRLKEGDLGGIVATGSLELGIDIGSGDAVVLAHAAVLLGASAGRGGG